jgi:hypothetical protein
MLISIAGNSSINGNGKIILLPSGSKSVARFTLVGLRDLRDLACSGGTR